MIHTNIFNVYNSILVNSRKRKNDYSKVPFKKIAAILK